LLFVQRLVIFRQNQEEIRDLVSRLDIAKEHFSRPWLDGVAAVHHEPCDGTKAAHKPLSANWRLIA
jgi:hypothetical protein